ncbi:MAG: hypothetical protein ACRC0L_10580, partial [Angustibacter sp.]
IKEYEPSQDEVDGLPRSVQAGESGDASDTGFGSAGLAGSGLLAAGATLVLARRVRRTAVNG